MTDKITLELTLDELKTLDKHIEYNEETQSVFDKIKYAYPQPKMTLANSGCVESVYYNNDYYYRIHFGSQCFPLWLKVNGNDMNTIADEETERLLEGLYYNHIEVKKKTAQERRERVRNEMEELARESAKWCEENPDKDPLEWLIHWNKLTPKTPQEPVSFVPKEMEELVKEGLEWCEDHPNENPLDWLTPKTPEETEESLNEAFREAQQTEKWKRIQQKIDDGYFNDFIFIDRPNLLDFLNKLIRNPRCL